jgi:hypothetical protein
VLFNWAITRTSSLLEVMAILNWSAQLPLSLLTRLKQIHEFGITNDDLDYMGITHPLHRSVTVALT